MESSKNYLFFSVCGCPGAWACGCAYVRVAWLIQHVMRVPHNVTSFEASQAPLSISAVSHKRHCFRKKITERKICVLIFFTNLSKTFLILRRI